MIEERPGRRSVDRTGQTTTRDRILATSLDLFNKSGILAVSVDLIREELGLSPGNLYYHFRNKEHILSELWEWLMEEVEPTLPPTSADAPLPAEALAAFLAESVDLVWRYRCFFRNMNEMLEQYPRFRASFYENTTASRHQLSSTFEQLIRHGIMSGPTDDADRVRLSTAVHILAMHWLQFMTSSNIGQKEQMEGCALILTVIGPYLEPTYAKEVRAALEARNPTRHVAHPARKLSAPSSG